MLKHTEKASGDNILYTCLLHI